jgi:hypothetical protein
MDGSGGHLCKCEALGRVSSFFAWGVAASQLRAPELLLRRFAIKTTSSSTYHSTFIIIDNTAITSNTIGDIYMRAKVMPRLTHVAFLVLLAAASAAAGQVRLYAAKLRVVTIRDRVGRGPT